MKADPGSRAISTSPQGNKDGALAGKARKKPDPLGKNALFWATPTQLIDRTRDHQGDLDQGRLLLPARAEGKKALFSNALRPGEPISPDVTLPPKGGILKALCSVCDVESRISILDYLILGFPIPLWIPKGKFDRFIKCPSCKERTWMSISITLR